MNFKESVEHHQRVKEIGALMSRVRKITSGRSTKKSLTQWIRANREEIDRAIKSACDNCRLNDRERRLWVLNDEGLYNLAMADGVRV